MSPFFYRAGMLLFLGIFPWFKPTLVWAQKQSFETPFSVVSYPQAFLPGWYANELRSTAARVFRLATSGLNGSGALAVQPLTTFSGKIWIQLSTKGMDHPWVVFWAKSLRNGTGTRPALVHASWSSSLEGPFVERKALGPASQFPNANQEFKRVELEVPASLEDQEEIYLLLEIGAGAGTGSAARWVMDEFGLENRILDEQPPKVVEVKGYGRREVLLSFSEAIDPVFARLALAYGVDGEVPSEIRLLKDSVVVLQIPRELEEEKEYPLFVQSLPDLSGNFLKDTLLRFTYRDPTRYGPKSRSDEPPEKGTQDSRDFSFYLNKKYAASRILDSAGGLCATLSSKSGQALGGIWDGNSFNELAGTIKFGRVVALTYGIREGHRLPQL
jgi:hypothetical protein